MKMFAVLIRVLIGALVFSSNVVASQNCFPSIDRALSISGDCDEISRDFIDGPRAITSFIAPRSTTSDLTYRNSIIFYQRFRGDASCTFLTLDSRFIGQHTRKGTRLGRGLFGTNPLLVAQHGAPISSVNLGLRSSQPEGFCSTLRVSPKRKLFAWLPQFIFNLECLCDCLWADLAFAVVRADHELGLFEQVVTPGDSPERSTIEQALDQLNTFPLSDTHTGVDDVELRVGYTIPYCEDDMFGLYLFGSIPTRRQIDNSRWFQPLVGTRSGGIGVGFIFDSTLWYSEFSESECLFMTELKYRHHFSHTDTRIFDLKNGPLSRFLLVAPQEDPDRSQSGTTLLRKCVTIEPHNSVDWWFGIHYTYYQWGFEVGYNLWYREEEHIETGDFDFKNFGIFDMTRTTGRTSHSNARVSDGPGEGTPDPAFVTLTSSRVKIRSAEGRKALSHTFSGAFTYNSYWCDYVTSVSFGARYEAAGHKRHTSTLENWGIYGSVSISC